MNKILLYGATGYSGSLIARKAKDHKINFVLAGRDENKLKKLSNHTGFDYRVFTLDDITSIEKGLCNITYVLNVAGPFIDGLADFVKCCIRLKIHFIDLAMNPNALASYNESAIANDVMILSGAGHAFMPIDCLCGYLHEKLPDAKRIKFFISGMNTMSHGTAKSNIALFKHGIYHLRGGLPYKIRNMNKTKMVVNKSLRSFVPSSFGVATVNYSTGISDIESFFEATPAVKPFIFIIKYLSWLLNFNFMQRILKKQIDKLPPGPTNEQLETGSIEYLSIIENEKSCHSATLHTPEAYKATYLIVLHVLKKLDNHLKPGFLTPYRLFGSQIINELPGFKLIFQKEDLQC